MKKLQIEQMEVVNGGVKITAKDIDIFCWSVGGAGFVVKSGLAAVSAACFGWDFGRFLWG